MAGELEGKVGLHAGVNFAWATVVNIPSAVGQLAFENVADTAALKRFVHFAEPVHEENEIGAERAIDHQLANPMAIGLLLAKQVFLRERHRFRQLLDSR
jgi:hypothetical protein